MFIDIIKNFDFVIVGMASILMVILSVTVLLSDRRSTTNKTFFLLSLSIIVWSLLNYFSFQYHDHKTVLWILRFVMFFAVWFAFFIFKFLYVLPSKEFVFNKIYKFIILPSVIFVSVLTLTPYVFQEISEFTFNGEVSGVINGPAITLFGVSTIGLNALGIFYLVKKMIQSKDRAKKRQYELILMGILLTVVLIILFNFLFPAFLNESRYISLAALFTFPFIAFTSYAILKHGLFNVKVIATQLLVFVIWIIILIELLLAEGMKERVLDGVVLLFVVIAGIFLIKSVKKEVAQREHIEKLAEDLVVANEKLKGLDKLKSEFLSLASHQLRSPLTAIKGYTSMLVEGSYGKLEEKQKEIVGHVQSTSQSMISMVEDFLNVSKIEQGGMQYVFVPTDLSKMVATLFEEMKISADNKHLEFALEMDVADTFTVNADAGKLKQVFLNLVDNSIKYTPSGFVHMSLVRNREKNTVTFSVKDSGVGVSPETKEKLFQKFNRGEGGKLNTGGSGIGLYLAKEITEAHHGEIVIESEGLGKGSSFKVVLPLDAGNKGSSGQSPEVL